MRRICFLCILFILLGCSQEHDVVLNNIRDFQGFWRDTIIDGEKEYISEFIVDNYVMDYTLSDAETHVMYDVQNGALILGNENRIGWYCTSLITNETRETFWDIHKKSVESLSLYSIMYGGYEYKRAYRALLDEFVVKDTMASLLYYSSYLPLSSKDVAGIFGSFNGLSCTEGYEYMIKHPLYDRIYLKGNTDNDSVYSFSLRISSPVVWQECERHIESRFAKIREIGGLREYCSNESLENSSYVLLLDSVLGRITYSFIKDYDYWPNISRFIGRNISEVKKDFENYVYLYQENLNLGLLQYSFQTSGDQLYSYIAFVTDTDGCVVRTGLSLLERYSSTQERKILHLLNSKYSFDRYENGVYYYHQNDIGYEVRYNAKGRQIVYFYK